MLLAIAGYHVYYAFTAEQCVRCVSVVHSVSLQRVVQIRGKALTSRSGGQKQVSLLRTVLYIILDPQANCKGPAKPEELEESVAEVFEALTVGCHSV